METIQFVCHHFSVTKEQLMGSRKNNLMDIKKMIVQLLILEGYKFSMIGLLMGYKDHTTPIWLRDSFSDLIVTDMGFKKEFNNLKYAYEQFKINNAFAAEEITCFA